MNMYSPTELHFDPQSLNQICRHFQIPIPPLALEKTATIQIFAPEQHAFEDLLSLIKTDNTKTLDNPAKNPVFEYSLEQPLLNWGIARSESSYVEDLVCSHSESNPYHLTRWEQNGAVEDLKHEALQKLLFQMRCLLGDRDWLIFWGKTETHIYLLSIFPSGWKWHKHPWQLLTGLPLTNQISPLSSDILQAALDEWRERLNPARLDSEDIDYNWFETLAGKFIYAPGAIHTELFGTSEQNLSFTRLISNSLLPRKMKQNRQKIWETFLVPHSQVNGYLQQWQEVLRLSLPLYFQTSLIISPWCAFLDKQNVLNAYLQQAQPNRVNRIEAKLLALKEQIAQMTENQQGQEPGIRDILRYPGFKTNWQLFLSDFGHLSPEALDLSRPRFQEQPEQLLRQIKAEWIEHNRSEDWENKHWVLLPIWKIISRLLLQQEELLSDALWALDQIRQRILSEATQLCETKILTHQSEIWWHLSSELENPAVTATEHRVLEERKSLHLLWQKNGVLLSENIDKQNAPAPQGLKLGLAQGKIFWYEPSETLLPEEIDPETILVIQDIDFGWIPLIKRCQGVILTAGTPFDTAALILRQLGVPALICHNLSLIPPTGTEIRLNSDTGTLTRLTDQH